MSLKLKPGVVHGAAYRDLVDHCKEAGYALPAVNITGTNTLNAVLEAARTAQSDVIVQMSNGGAAFFAGQGHPDKSRAMVLGAASAARHVHMLAADMGVCVILHTDHANRKLVPWVDAMIDIGQEHYSQFGGPLFSSHMIDLSEEPLDSNLSECARVLERLAPLDMSVEIELGVTGGEEDGVGSDDDIADNPKLYTQPEDVLLAYDRLNAIGPFSIAASFGNVHGVYSPGNVRLRPEILKASQDLVAGTHGLARNPLDLVFHGGSGSDLGDIRAAISYGVFKMNIDTDTQFAFAQGIGDYVRDHAEAFRNQLDPVSGQPLKKQYDPRVWLREGELSMRDRVVQACRDLGSIGKSVAV